VGPGIHFFGHPNHLFRKIYSHRKRIILADIGQKGSRPATDFKSQPVLDERLEACQIPFDEIGPEGIFF
jgi:hypothetical protein